jgi:hypothetical protein
MAGRPFSGQKLSPKVSSSFSQSFTFDNLTRECLGLIILRVLAGINSPDDSAAEIFSVPWQKMQENERLGTINLHFS